MNENERQYTDRIEQGKLSRCEPESLSYFLPEWITNLKNYFEKDTISNNPSYHK